jgi:hypothetical protein
MHIARNGSIGDCNETATLTCTLSKNNTTCIKDSSDERSIDFGDPLSYLSTNSIRAFDSCDCDGIFDGEGIAL